MTEPLKIGFRFTHTLDGCRIAGLHIDADDVPRIVVYRVPQPAVSVLHTSFLNAREEAGWGMLPGVLFLGHDACSVVVSKGFFGKLRVAQSGTDRLESFVNLLRSIDAAVLQHELIN